MAIGKKAGRPENYSGPAKAIADVFVQHFHNVRLNKRALNPHCIFDYTSDPGVEVDVARLRKRLDLLLGLRAAAGGTQLGGPLQVRALLLWNRQTKFHARNGSRSWAMREVAKLWCMERHLAKIASNPEAWLELVGGDLARYPRIDTSEWPSESPSGRDDSQSHSVSSAAAPGAGLPAWLLSDMTEMMDAEEDEDDTSDEGEDLEMLDQAEEAEETEQAEEEENALAGVEGRRKAGDGQETRTVASSEEGGGADLERKGRKTEDIVPKVFVEKGVPFLVDSHGRTVFGSFEPDASATGNAMATFPGFGSVEVPCLTHKELCGMKTPDEVKGRAAQKKRKGGTPISGKKTRCLTKKPARSDGAAANNSTQQDEKKTVSDHTKTKKGKKASKTAAGGKKQPAAKPLRPLQLFLLERPSNVKALQRMEEWRKLSPKEKTKYGVSTAARRGVRC